MVVSKTTNFGLVWFGVLLTQSYSKILWSSVSLEKVDWYHCLTIAILSFIFTYLLASFIKLSGEPYRYHLLFQSPFYLLNQYCTPEKACDFIFLTEILPKNMTLKKPRNSKSRLGQKLFQFLVFSLWRHLWQTIRIGANFLCNFLYLGKFLVNLLENWYKMRKIIV